MQIFIVRHGESVANAEEIIAGQHESPLSQRGEAAAARAGQQAKQYHFDAIVSSPMGRARQTATIIADAIGYDPAHILVLEDLRERFLGDIEGKHYSETKYGSGNSELTEEVPNIEHLDHLAERCRRALEHIKTLPAETVLIACHNGTGRMLQTVARGESPQSFYQRPRLENAVIYPLVD